LADRLKAPIARCLDRDRNRLGRVSAALSALNPQATLARGFSITRNPEGRVITSASQVKRGETIRTQLAEGEIDSVIEAGNPGA
jgi:exodeoxyribonuclease VII large subunit